MNKIFLIIIAIAALLGILYIGGKAVKHSMMNQQSTMNYGTYVSPTSMMQSDQSEDIVDSQDDQSLSQVATDDNANLSDSNGL